MAPIRHTAVSIPSSSGHQFTVTGIKRAQLVSCGVSIPSSSGHQFTAVRLALDARVVRQVSIPSSSGHQFTAAPDDGRAMPKRERFNPFFIRASVYCNPSWVQLGHASLRFNPFFIRASVYCVTQQGHAQRRLCMEFQSLLHQGISLLAYVARNPRIRALYVSIPSSSGHQFTGTDIASWAQKANSAFQSLLHQGISLLVCLSLGTQGKG